MKRKQGMVLSTLSYNLAGTSNMGGGDKDLIIYDCCLEEMKDDLSPVPVVGKIYLSWDEIYKMYETYGEISGFGIRVSGYKKWKGEITHRVWYVTRQVLYEFSKNHNHELISSENMDLTRKGKHLNFEDVHFVHGVLQAIFWADDVSKFSYQLFSDVLAFDATYSTNKFNMIFVPFTGVGHHKKCVTFGVGLIHNETVETYCWLLQAFLKIHVKHPPLV
ncbi:hypothetical protein E3N88_40175 [Mikania micrantha]|uniref:MULE transposase domain-containing protein n=1 Tax=Mikania micrantha TaxID=192012 RepID=A0A5N6LP62_9ASTR|nr:hypothetical protein E3N88_40175 [Mikania micrantha]